MKKSISLALLLCMFSAASQAQPRIHAGTETAKFRYIEMAAFSLFAMDEKCLYAYTSNSTFISGGWSTNYLTLYKISEDGALLQEKQLTEFGKKSMVVNAFLNDDQIDMLIITDFRSDSRKMVHARYDKNSLEPKQEPRDFPGLSCIVSPDRNWVGGIDDDNNFTMYSNDMEVVWSKKISQEGIINYFVTNEAELVLLGARENSGETELYAQVISDEKEENFVGSMDLDGIATLTITNYKNGRIYAGGLTFHWSDAKNPKNRTKLYDGCHSLVFDTRTQKIETDRKGFRLRDVSALLNSTPQKKSLNEPATIMSLPYSGRLSTDKNMVLAYHYIPSIVYEGNYFYGGCMMFGIDDEGKISWIHFIRRSNSMSNEMFMVQTLFELQGKPCIAYSISKKGAYATDDLKPVPNVKFQSSSTKVDLVMASVNNDGELEKTILDEQLNKPLLSSIGHNGKRAFLLFRAGRANVLTIE